MRHFEDDELNFDSSDYNKNSFEDRKNSRGSSVNRTNQTQESDKDKCVFCPKLKNFKETFHMLNKALYLKYSSSQNYYYTKDINDLVEHEKKPHVINFKFNVAFEEEEENLTRFYNSSEFEYKLSYLTEYYKYHREVPRLFMIPICNIMNNFHDKKRRIEYFKIKKMLNEQNKGVVTNHDRNERESTEEKKSSIYSDESADKNKDSLVIKINENSSKILAMLDLSSKNDMKEIQKPDKKSSKIQNHEEIFQNEKNNIYNCFNKKTENLNENKENQSITLEELNFYLNKLSDSEEKPNKNVSEYSSKQEILNEIGFEFSEVKVNENDELKSSQFKKQKTNYYNEAPKQNHYQNLKTDSGTDLFKSDSKVTRNTIIGINKNDATKSCKAASSFKLKQSEFMQETPQQKPPNNLQKALQLLEIHNSGNLNKNSINQFLTFRDLSKNMQIFNKLIEQQKSQMSEKKHNNNSNSNNTKSHRIFNSIDFNNLKINNIKSSFKQTPKNNNDLKAKTASLSNFQNFLNTNKEKLNRFMQNKLNSQPIDNLKLQMNAEKNLKNSSSNSIKKGPSNSNYNHRRILSSENGNNQCYSAKNNNREKILLKNNIFQSAVHIKKALPIDIFPENLIYSPKPVMTTMSELSPNKHLKHFKPISPKLFDSIKNPMNNIKENIGGTFAPKKPAPVGFRKLNLDEKIYIKKNRVKPKSFQLHLKTTENERDNIFTEYKMKDPGNSKNTSINSKGSGNLTSNSRKKDHSLNINLNNFKQIPKGESCSSLKYHNIEDNNSKTQQMKINIISNFFNFNNGLEQADKDINPIYLKLKNEFSNMKNFPNYKFLDINLISKLNEKQTIKKKSKIKVPN